MVIGSGGGPVRFQIFGGLRVWRDGQELDLGSTRHRVVLAMLLVADGGVVGVDELLEALWEESLPSTAVNQLHQIVGQLRRLLEPGLAPRATGGWLASESEGYRLRLPDNASSDLGQCRELRARAHDAAGAGGNGAHVAVDSFVAALELTRRPAFIGLPAEVLHRPEFVALQVERIGLAVEAACVAVEIDRSAEVLQTVDAISAEAPLHERLQAMVIRLLAGSGRRADALDRYRQIRLSLAEDLGIDPSSELRAAHRAALNEDAGNSSEDGAGVSTTARSVSSMFLPAQLPAAIPGFAGRETAMRALEEMVGAASRTVLVTAVGGMAGIGKTALAVRWAHSVADQFPDGQLYVNLRGFDPDGRVMSSGEALNFMLDSLGVSSLHLADHELESGSARLRSAMSGRRVLILLDNAFDAEQLRPLLPGTPGCLVIVTSRNRLPSLVVHEGARPLMLGQLTPTEAHQLLANRMGERRVRADRASADAIVAACGGLPLALSIVAARAATCPEIPLADLAASLTASHRLEALASGEYRDDIRAAFTWSYQTLSSRAARLFRFIGAYPGNDASVETLASMTNMSLPETQRDAAELVGGSLISEISTGRFTMHDLLKIYAAELLDKAGEREPAERRLVQHVAASARSAFLFHRADPQTQLDPIDEGIHAEPQPDALSAAAWYARERNVIRAAVDLAIGHAMYRTACLIYLDCRPLSWAVDPLSEMLPLSRAALDSARRAGDLHLQAQLESDVARRIPPTDATVQRWAHFDRALEIYRELGDLVGESITLRSLGVARLETNGDPQQAINCFRESVGRARQSGSPHELARSLGELATALRLMHDAQGAAITAEEALDVVRESGPAAMEPKAALTLATCLLDLGDTGRAADIAEWGLEQTLGLTVYDEELSFARVLAVSAFRDGDMNRALSGCRRFRQVIEGEERHQHFEAMDKQYLAETEQEIDQILAALALHAGDTPGQVLGRLRGRTMGEGERRSTETLPHVADRHSCC